jgi:nucleotide-binding universal stress UspA family protein
MPAPGGLRRSLARVPVATDCSAHGDEAVDRAARLPLTGDATVVLLGVPGGGAVVADPWAQAGATKRLGAIAERFGVAGEAHGAAAELRLQDALRDCIAATL